MTVWGQISWVFLSVLLFPLTGKAVDLASDEKGPTAVNALSVATLQDDFLTPTFTLPADPMSVEIPLQKQETPVQKIPEGVDIVAEIFGKNALMVDQMAPPTPKASPSTTTKVFTPTPKNIVNIQKALLTPLPELPQPMVIEEEDIPPYTPYIQQSTKADEVLQAMQSGSEIKGAIPREVRIRFYPNQASFSAHSLKWVKAFALKVLKDPRYRLDIRASSEDWPLQSKRVGLLIQIILEQGVSRHQIRIFKTEREVNTVLLGYTQTEIIPNEMVKHERKKQKTLRW